MPLSPQHSNHRLWILRLGSPFLRSTSPSEQKDHKNDGDAPHLVLWVTLFIFILKQVYKQWFYKQWFNVGDAISFFQHCRTDCHPRPGLWFQILFTLILFSFFWTQTMICILGTIDQMFMLLWIVVLNSHLWLITILPIQPLCLMNFMHQSGRRFAKVFPAYQLLQVHYWGGKWGILKPERLGDLRKKGDIMGHDGI